MEIENIKLTSYSSAAGCGCKIDSGRLKNILSESKSGVSSKSVNSEKLLVGNENNEDAAAYYFDEKSLLLSTIDFFTPVVDDPYDFGYIAAANAISDIYAMGGKPIFALSVLGWPIKDIAESVASKVMQGATDACSSVNIMIAGGHSIENKEPIFGLSVNGMVSYENVKLNKGAKSGDVLYLTKALGAGILTTAIKKGLILKEDYEILLLGLKKINSIGFELGKIKGVHAMTDVTGFGLAGHLIEMCLASNVKTKINARNLPLLTDLKPYIEKDSLPGGLHKNWKNYVDMIDESLHGYKEILADPQTNGGLLIAVDPSAASDVEALLFSVNQLFDPIGKMVSTGEKIISGV
ncbi:MAG: selenide, water dikinase SelD [Spirochaetia bacterium]|nr:selenide, water dikinase SelD [Spirochaetia bacterium]